VNPLILWLAQGFGIGRIPFAPGTFGSLLGLAWFALLLAAGSLWLFVAGTIFGIAISVWLCGEAEKILKKTDPGSVVFDEICAIPICFLVSIGMLLHQNGKLPSPEYFFSAQGWLQTVAVFVLFRFFDVVKPWPVRGSQKLHCGLGVTIDDVLAAGYVNGCMALLFAARVF